jgi:hypothetical protein
MVVAVVVEIARRANVHSGNRKAGGDKKSVIKSNKTLAHIPEKPYTLLLCSSRLNGFKQYRKAQPQRSLKN